MSPRTQALASRAETMLTRLEDRAEGCSVRTALHRALTRLEAISSVRVVGKRPRFRTVIKAESLVSFDEPDSVSRLDSLDCLDFSNDDEWHTTLEVLYYQMAAERIYRTEGWGTAITPGLLADLHSLARFGRAASASGVRPRQRAHRTADASGREPGAYTPPTPESVPPLLEDLCAFVNQELYSPITQAAIAHFQFEGIKPFKSELDKTGRLMSHAVIHRRGLSRHLIAPIGLAPAIDTLAHAQALLTYNFGTPLDEAGIADAVDRWTNFCAYATEVSVRAADVCLDAIIELRNSWLDRVGRLNRGSAVGELLNLLAGQPVLTVRQAAGMVGKSVSAVNDALLRLGDEGVVASHEGLRREGIYIAPEAVDVLERLESEFIPHGPVARDSLGERAKAV